MFKQGKTKVPVEKVKAIALALDLVPIDFLRLVMTQDHPEAWSVIEDIIGKDVLSPTGSGV